jgi:hypothetical protein
MQVKADVQNVSGELIVSGLDSATSLIQEPISRISTSAKNFSHTILSLNFVQIFIGKQET